MEIIEINQDMFSLLHDCARKSERLRINKDLRTTHMDNSQRMLNVLEIGTKVPIHRHKKTSETILCINGKLDVVFYDFMPVNDEHKCLTNGAVSTDGMKINIFEVNRVRLCPNEGRYGLQIPIGVWHSVDVYEPSVIFEAKDGAYKPMSVDDVWNYE